MLISVEITPDNMAGEYSFADVKLISLVECRDPERTRLMISSTDSLESDMDMRCLREAECDAKISDETEFERSDKLTIFKSNSSSISTIDDCFRDTAGLGDL